MGARIRTPVLAASDLALDDRGYLTRESLADLRTRFPNLELAVWETRPFTKSLDLITVGGIANLVRSALAAGERAPAAK